MQIVQGNVLQSLRAVQAFLDAHADLLASVANSGARKKLDAHVEGLSTHVATQSGSGLVRVAIRMARAIARANGSELIVQGRRGQIRFRDSHGSDPYPPKG